MFIILRCVCLVYPSTKKVISCPCNYVISYNFYLAYISQHYLIFSALNRYLRYSELKQQKLYKRSKFFSEPLWFTVSTTDPSWWRHKDKHRPTESFRHPKMRFTNLSNLDSASRCWARPNSRWSSHTGLGGGDLRRTSKPQRQTTCCLWIFIWVS